MPDPDLEIRGVSGGKGGGEGGGRGRSSRPLDSGGGGRRLEKKFFSLV